MIEPKTRVTFIINPISGTHQKDGLPKLVESELDSSRFQSEMLLTEHVGHATELAHAAVERKADVCVAVGGDGTVNEVARALVGTSTALGIIPCGSGNGLARHLSMPLDAKQALRVINRGIIDTFDYGTINDLPFFCTCGMGFDAFISLKFAEAGKRGPITYVENVLREGLKYRPETYIVSDEEGTQQHKAFLIACANAAQYGNNAYIAPGASMKDGLMDVIIMEPFDALEAPTIAYDLFSKTLNQNSKIKTFKAKHIHIERAGEGAVHCDGDPIIMGRDIHVDMHPLGLRIVVPSERCEDPAEPNAMLNAFSDFFNNINNVRGDILRGGKRFQLINKLMLRRLSRL